MDCLWCFCCCRCLLIEKKNTTPGLNAEEIHQYVPFKDVVEQLDSSVYYESLRLKQKLVGHCREKK